VEGAGVGERESMATKVKRELAGANSADDAPKIVTASDEVSVISTPYVDRPASAATGAATSAATSATTDGATITPDRRGFRLSRRRDDERLEVAAQTIEALQHRIAELETAQLRAPRIQLAELDGVQLTELASETAVMILGAARSEAQALTRAAQARLAEAEKSANDTTADADERAAKLMADADARAKNMFAEAKAQADQLTAETQAQAAALKARAEELVASSTAEAEQLRASAAAQAEQVRASAAADAAEQLRKTNEQVEAARAAAIAEVERLRKNVEEETQAMRAAAEADGARIVEQAVARRDSLISELEAQRRIVEAMIDDSSAVRAVLIEAYGKSRETLELAIAKLNGPLDTAGRQAAAIEREIAAIQP
jgi:hypothetical protein